MQLVDEMAGIQLPVEISEEGISVKRKKVRLMSLMVHKKDTMRIKDEMTLVSNNRTLNSFCGIPSMSVEWICVQRIMW